MADHKKRTARKYGWIAPSNLPPRLPVFSTMVLWLFLDRLEPPQTYVAVIWTLWSLHILLALVSFLLRITKGEGVDVLVELDNKCEPPHAADHANAQVKRAATAFAEDVIARIKQRTGNN